MHACNPRSYRNNDQKYSKDDTILRTLPIEGEIYTYLNPEALGEYSSKQKNDFYDHFCMLCRPGGVLGEEIIFCPRLSTSNGGRLDFVRFDLEMIMD